MSLELGGMTLSMVDGGSFRLDGGAMFGVVPKAMWERWNPPDELNRIKLATRCLVVDTPGGRVIVDTGNGDKMDARGRERFGLEGPGVARALGEAGIDSESVGVVVNTHLHFDHAGGNTVLSENGELKPAFPEAFYVVQKAEWEEAMNPGEKQAPSYLGRELAVLERAERLSVMDGPNDVAPGVSILPTPGHTEGHQSVLIQGGGETALFPGDLCPTAAHLPYPYVMAFDCFPTQTIRTKRWILAQAVEQRWLVVFGHDPEIEAAYLKFDDKGRPAVDEAVTIGAP